MTKKNEQQQQQQQQQQTSSGSVGSNVVIVHQTHQNDLQHQQSPQILMPTMTNSAPMIITTPLAVPSGLIVPHQTTTQQLPTTQVIQNQQTTTTVQTTQQAATTTGKTPKKSAEDRLVCGLCNKIYRSSAGLRYHKRKRHRGMLKPTQLHRVRCLENGCAYQMLAISDLRNHLANHHLKPEFKTTEEKKFTSFTDFTDWKSSFESLTGSKYVKNCGAKGKSENQTTEYYYCNRTGPYKQTRQGWRRNSKALDSLRCGIHCTSSMKVEIGRNEQITVQYYPAHYGHTSEPALQAPATAANGQQQTTEVMNPQQTAMVATDQMQQQLQQQQVQVQQSPSDHCQRLQHVHQPQTSSIIINIAPVNTTIINNINSTSNTITINTNDYNQIKHPHLGMNSVTVKNIVHECIKVKDERIQ
ncbi:unnamed protein product [Didymodactylos carnosus]|uniref:C2H2-type domain-containing protein n=1 Tax=Didymodactylos carnosus TaxID=1234261 RepID=A0A813T7X6_9BILA|nr:unnamed protein product [Didymodactylos carnosus]CAF0810129.1 unnamed protein product [Didymodactylos carnosus]CAF3532282.1 unnamed protein product [Didymodactylos carnosus]CAF3595733.1 unnamed protein product [Didymodactylos carnosus]